MFSKKDASDFADQTINPADYIHTMQDDLKNPAQKNNALAAENIVNKTETAKSFSASPFLTEASPSSPKTEQLPEKTQPLPVYSKEPVEENESQKITPFATKTELPKISAKLPEIKEDVVIQGTAKEKSNWLGKLVAIVAVFLLLLGAAGAYFIWHTKQKQSTSSLSSPQETIPQNKKEATVTINPELENYSTENPNIISLNIETSTDASIQELLSQKATEVSKAQLKKPVEFIFTDQNNTPIAFPIFALTAKINLPKEILSNLEEKFSLYMYPENFGTRLGLAINVKNKDLVLTKMLAQEKTLPQDLAFLFLNITPENQTNILFKDNKYNDFSIRYLNLIPDGSLSIDYTVTNSQLIIGTSKNTLRAIIDKATTSSPVIPNSTISTNSTTPAL